MTGHGGRVAAVITDRAVLVRDADANGDGVAT